MVVKEENTVTLDFAKPVIGKLIFTNSKEEATRLEKEGYVIYFPSALTKEIEHNGSIYVLGNYEYRD